VSFDEIALVFPASSSSSSSSLKQYHLSLAPNAMWIMWVTDDDLKAPFARWGLNENDLSNQSNGTSHTYNVGFLGWHKWLHQARMDKLSTQTKYFYQFGNGEADKSEVLSFVTPGTTTAKIAFLGDQGLLFCYYFFFVLFCLFI
jgi:hypothetical protein